MIYTLTLNPAVDYILDDIELKGVYRFKEDQYEIAPGGKGINISLILKEHNIENKALVVTNGFMGSFIENSLENLGINYETYQGSIATRVNIKLNTTSGEAFELNGSAPDIKEQSKELLKARISKLGKDDKFVISGSMSENLHSFVKEIIEIARNNGVEVILDLSSKLLKDLLKYEPLMIKPNNYELEDILEIKINNLDDIKKSAKKLQKLGAKNVFVSLGSKGAYLLSENGQEYKAEPIDIKQISPQGAGDSFLTGAIIKYDKGPEQMLKYANACGAATASVMSLASLEEIKELENKSKVNTI